MLVVNDQRQQLAHYTDATGQRATISIHSPKITGPYAFDFKCLKCGRGMTAIRYTHDVEASHFFHLICVTSNASNG